MSTDLFSSLADFAKNYGSLIVGALGLIVTIFFGGKFVQTLMQGRIKHLEAELDNERQAHKDCAIRQENLTRELLAESVRVGGLNARIARIEGAFASDSVWLRKPIRQPEGYLAAMERSIPILVVANLKGGVGKTTIAANLVPYFERRHGRRVLAIDLDYQGSLSSMLLPEPHNRHVRTAKEVRALIEGSVSPPQAILDSKLIRGTRQESRVIDCDTSFANFETGLLVKWLHDESVGDVRYNLARFLLSRDVQERFGCVIIDAPPRLTTGFVSALCASTHLVVPFVMDALSAERVGLFLREVRTMRPDLFPHLEVAAVIGTMKRTNTETYSETERAALAEATSRVKINWSPGDYVLQKIHMPRRQDIADAAGLELAYLSSQDAGGIFDKIGDAIHERTRKHHEGRSS